MPFAIYWKYWAVNDSMAPFVNGRTSCKLMCYFTIGLNYRTFTIFNESSAVSMVWQTDLYLELLLFGFHRERSTSCFVCPWDSRHGLPPLHRLCHSISHAQRGHCLQSGWWQREKFCLAHFRQQVAGPNDDQTEWLNRCQSFKFQPNIRPVQLPWRKAQN